jgi:SAM-dependent methyltransferase
MSVSSDSIAGVVYGRDLPGDDELRLCGDISEGKRALELGVSNQYNAIAFAAAGAKSLAVDPDGARIARLRDRAAEAGVRIECHVGELADLEFATSGSVEVVLANGTLGVVDDLGRLLRQVHRVLKPSRSFVICLRHPFADVYQGEVATPYGSSSRTIEEWFTALGRANFRVDVLHELGVTPRTPVPTTLIVRARKEGS